MGEEREWFDYVVVGAGSAGCIVAAELAADPERRVLLLESGDPAEAHPETLEAAGYKDAFINPHLMHERFSTPQAACDDHQMFLGSGRGVGGSGSINAMVYTRGDEQDYAAWAVPGWSYGDLAPAFVELERRLDVHRQPPTRFTEACVRAAEATGFRRKEDLNDGQLCGYLGYEWMNLAGTERRSSYVAFLRPIQRLARGNLVVRTRCTVDRVRFDEGRRVVGVDYREAAPRGASTPRSVDVRREVVLCAGALETPRLLLLSGVGPARELAALGVPVVADLPGVGKNLQDHPNVTVFFRGAAPTDCSWAQLYGFHRAHPRSHLPDGMADTCYVFYSARSSFREGVIRMLPTMILPPRIYRMGGVTGALRGAIKAAFRLAPVRWLVERMYGVVVILGKPQSRGQLRLRSSRPDDPAEIDPGYFSVPHDLEALVHGVHLARRIAGAPALAAWGNREMIPGAAHASDDQIARFIRKNAMTTYHYAGTCQMARGLRDADEPAAVVDAQLRLRGVRGVRIADASVIPTVPVSAMNAPSMIIGYRAAQLLRADPDAGGRR